ncbi:MAG TPA: hypothetical protein VI756_10450 [Blastocatellia bacterium]
MPTIRQLIIDWILFLCGKDLPIYMSPEALYRRLTDTWVVCIDCNDPELQPATANATDRRDLRKTLLVAPAGVCSGCGGHKVLSPHYFSEAEIAARLAQYEPVRRKSALQLRLAGDVQKYRAREAG